MHRIIFFLFLFSVSQVVLAQEKTKYWIFLTDKQDASAKHTQVEENYLTDKAVARRTLRGQLNKTEFFVKQDAPISTLYENTLQQSGYTIIQRSRWLNAVTTWLTEEERKQVAALPFVRKIQPVGYLSSNVLTPVSISPVIPQRVSSNCPSNLFGPSCDQLDLVNAIPALMEGINGQGVVLGFLDTNFNPVRSSPFSHSSLEHIPNSGRLGGTRDFTERVPSERCNGGGNVHGMNVASVAVGYHEGSLIGPGHGATVFGASTECAPYERNIEEDNFVAGVEWLESQGVDVMTSSLGYFGFDPGQQSYAVADLDGDTGLTTIVMDWAASRGVITVTSAGNAGPRPQSIRTPADGDSVISVGGVFSSRNVVQFSSRGPTADGRIKPDVSAQASGVYIGRGTQSYGRSAGTSFSAPMVAGIITQMLQVNPNLGPRDVWRLLTSTANQASSPDNDLGWGIVDAYAAIRAGTLLNRSEKITPLPDMLTVHSPYPNPFQDVVHFVIDAVEPVPHVQFVLFDILGREVATIYEGLINSGGASIQFDGSHLPAGIYTYTLKYGGRMQSGLLAHLGN